MTDQQQSIVREGQRGLLGALLLMLALVVGQFVTLERKTSFRPGSESTVTRTAAAEKAANRGALPRPLSAGGGASSSDNWLISNGGDRRVAKVKSVGSGGPSADPAFVVSDEFVLVAPRPDARLVLSFDDASPAGTPRHNFEGRAPPARLL